MNTINELNLENFPDRGYKNYEIKYNKTFLAMLNEYVGKSGYQFPDPTQIKALDFGCGDMPYDSGLITFFKHYKQNGGQNRHVHLIGVDPKQRAQTAQAEGICLDIAPMRISSALDVSNLMKIFDINRFDAVTVFTPGGTAGLSPYDILEAKQGKFYEETVLNPLINFVTPKIRNNGLLIVGTVSDGVLTDDFLNVLKKKPDFDILLNEDNKFKNGRLQDLEHIIIAKKKD
jgi:hypothetical protein